MDKKVYVIQVRVNRDLRDWLEKLAIANGNVKPSGEPNLSETVRRILTQEQSKR